jgi:type IV secretion system protein VirB6
MSTIQYQNLIADLGIQIKLITSAYTVGGYETVAAKLRPPFGAACLLFITLKGFAILFGAIKEPINDFAKSAIKIGLIFSLITSWSFFASYFVDFLTSAANQIGEVLMYMSPVTDSRFKSIELTKGLQLVLNEVVQVGNWTFSKGSWTNIGPYITAILIWFSGGAVVFYTFSEIIISMMMSSVLYCVAPLFIILTLFEITRGWFDKWLSSCVSYALILIFVSAVGGFFLQLVHASIPITSAGTIHPMHLTGWFPIAFCSLLCIKATREAVGLAKSIGGNFSGSSGSEMVGGLIASGLGIASSAKAKGTQAAKLAGSVGLMAGSLGQSAALAPLRMGAFMVSKKYRAKTKDRVSNKVRNISSKF